MSNGLPPLVKLNLDEPTPEARRQALENGLKYIGLRDLHAIAGIVAKSVEEPLAEKGFKADDAKHIETIYKAMYEDPEFYKTVAKTLPYAQMMLRIPEKAIEKAGGYAIAAVERGTVAAKHSADPAPAIVTAYKDADRRALPEDKPMLHINTENEQKAAEAVLTQFDKTHKINLAKLNNIIEKSGGKPISKENGMAAFEAMAALREQVSDFKNVDVAQNTAPNTTTKIAQNGRIHAEINTRS